MTPHSIRVLDVRNDFSLLARVLHDQRNPKAEVCKVTGLPRFGDPPSFAILLQLVRCFETNGRRVSSITPGGVLTGDYRYSRALSMLSARLRDFLSVGVMGYKLTVNAVINNRRNI